MKLICWAILLCSFVLGTRLTAETNSIELIVDAEKTADELLSRLASYVDTTSSGNVTIIESAGMYVRNPSEPVGLLPAPQNLRVLEGALSGEVQLVWNSTSGAYSYEVQMTQMIDDPSSWVHMLNCTKAKTAVKNLTVAQRYWFRIAAINAAGQGPFSDPAARIVT